MIKIVGSHGVIWVGEDGIPIASPPAYSAIRRFDLPRPVTSAVDILTVGYWVGEARIPPEVVNEESVERLNSLAEESSNEDNPGDDQRGAVGRS
jgi:hypothetical protein